MAWAEKRAGRHAGCNLESGYYTAVDLPKM